MILQKFFIVAFMWHFMTAAPADSGESEITTTFLTESTSTTTLLETSTTVIDAQHNELDAKFTNGDEKLTTTSDVDKKIESIEEDSSSQPMEKAVTEETNDTITSKDETKTVEEVQEPKDNKKLERFVTETSGKKESTTMKIDPTSSTIATRVVLLQKPEDKSVMENREMAERAQTLQQIKKMLRAHVLRAVLTILNEARKRQTQEQYTSESQVVRETLHVSGSKFDDNLQRYVDIDGKQPDHMNLTPKQQDHSTKDPSSNAIKKIPNSTLDESNFSPPCLSCSLEGYERLLNY